MLDDEVQVLEAGCCVVDIGNIERVAVQRQDRRALVNVDVLDAQLLAALKVLLGRRVGKLAARNARR